MRSCIVTRKLRRWRRVKIVLRIKTFFPSFASRHILGKSCLETLLRKGLDLTFSCCSKLWNFMISYFYKCYISFPRGYRMSAVWVNPYPLIPVLQDIGFMLFTWFFFFLSGRGLPWFPESHLLYSLAFWVRGDVE